MKMKISVFAAALCGVCSFGVNAAGQLTVPVTAEATVNNACSTSTSALDFNFGTVRSGNLGSTREISANLTVSCTGNTPYTFSTSSSASNSQFSVGKTATTASNNSQNPADCKPELGAGGFGTGNIHVGADGIYCTVAGTSTYTGYGLVTLAVLQGGSYKTLDTMSSITPTVDATGNAQALTTPIYARLSGSGNPYTDPTATFPNTNDSYTQQPGTNLYINY